MTLGNRDLLASVSTMSEHAPTSSRTLSEAESKVILADAGVRFAGEARAADADTAVDAAAELGGRVVVKLNGDRIAHKSERGLVRVNISGADAVRRAVRVRSVPRP